MIKSYTKRQTQIIQASVSIIAEKGIQGLTMKNIAAAIGISLNLPFIDTLPARVKSCPELSN